jgi:hypothetical protein
MASFLTFGRSNRQSSILEMVVVSCKEEPLVLFYTRTFSFDKVND